ncbi:hypothetical protein [Maricaulis sp. CAU 1757]
MTVMTASPRVRKLLLIAAGLFVLGTAFVLSVGPFSVGAIEGRLRDNAMAALETRGHDWATVRMNGQVAVLTGAAPSDLDRIDAVDAVANSTWAGGMIAGGVTRVIDETIPARVERGFLFRADMSLNGRVQIRGDASDAQARDAITRFAEANFSQGADTDLTLVPGGAVSPEWEVAARRLLGQLARLERGAVVLQGNQAALVGEAANPQIAQSVANALANMPLPFTAASLVTPAGAPSVSRIPSVAACATVIRAAQGTEALRFERDGPAASPLTAVALRRIARAFAACPDNARLAITLTGGSGLAQLDQGRIATVRNAFRTTPAADRVDVAVLGEGEPGIVFSITSTED